jgi:hypothetical protein
MTATATKPRTTNPEGVLEKVGEARYFLARVPDHENDSNEEDFLRSLSAFLNAFRTITFRLKGVTEHKHGKEKADLLYGQLWDHLGIGFLIRQRDVEVHQDGAVVFRRYTIHPGNLVPEFMDKYAHRDKYADQFVSRFGTRTGAGVVIRYVGGWEFKGNPKSLIELGHDALDALEVFIRQALA